jgi:hypothetical protein
MLQQPVTGKQTTSRKVIPCVATGPEQPSHAQSIALVSQWQAPPSCCSHAHENKQTRNPRFGLAASLVLVKQRLELAVQRGSGGAAVLPLRPRLPDEGVERRQRRQRGWQLA